MLVVIMLVLSDSKSIEAQGGYAAGSLRERRSIARHVQLLAQPEERINVRTLVVSFSVDYSLMNDSHYGFDLTVYDDNV